MKKLVRTQLREVLRNLSQSTIDTESNYVVQHVLKMEEYQQAQRLCCYMPMKQEINTLEIIRDALNQNKAVYVPIIMNNENIDMVRVVDNKDFDTFVLNKWSILEPPTHTLQQRENGNFQIYICLTISVNKQGASSCHNTRPRIRFKGKSHWSWKRLL